MKTNKINIAAVQEDLIWENPTENLSLFERYIINNIGADLFILPELFSTGFTMNVQKFGQSSYGNTLKSLIDISKKYNVSICGSLIIKEKSNYYNRFVFIDSENPTDYQFYDKKHLFRMGEENEHYTAGDKRVVIKYRGFRILPMICYDLRFPVWSRYNNDYDMIIYVANWPAPRRNHWDVLLKARAIENQAYVVGVNRIGTDGRNIKYNGGTVILSPTGEIVAKSDDNLSQLIRSDIDLDTIIQLREKFPAWKDKDDFKLT